MSCITFNGKFNVYAKSEVTENSNRVNLIKSSSFGKISGLVDNFQNFKSRKLGLLDE